MIPAPMLHRSHPILRQSSTGQTNALPQLRVGPIHVNVR